jgi:hypothetical protein
MRDFWRISDNFFSFFLPFFLWTDNLLPGNCFLLNPPAGPDERRNEPLPRRPGA